jgi:CRISPR-associated protein Cas1
MKEVIASKLNNQIANIRFLADRKQGQPQESEVVICEMDHLTTSLLSIEISSDADCLKTIRYYEAIVAKNYWQLIGGKLPPPFNFLLRTKQNPTDAFNPLLNYMYGMLRNQVETAILSFGLDPALGCMHRDGYKLPSLVFDLMEPYRPLIDRRLIEVVFTGKLNNSTEIDEFGLTRITREGRKKVITVFNEKLHQTCLYKKTKTSLLNHIMLETKQLVDKIKRYE